MGTNSIPTASDGTIIPAADHNSLKSAMVGDQVPRNVSGDATADAGDIGTTTFPFRKANVTAGYFFPGMIMPVHDFNGAVTPGQGWMKCDGTIINETNYNAIHGAGSWATYVGATALDGKHTPNFVDRYPIGVANTTQDGSSAITETGVSGSSFTIANHQHTVAGHQHTWYDNPAGTPQDGAGNPIQEAANGTTPNFTIDTNVSPKTYVTDSVALASTFAGGFTQSIKPASMEVEYWIRII